jgi:quercetin 2,3-dioxygenase
VPSYATGHVPAAPGLTPLVSGRPGHDAPVRLHTSGAALHVARLGRGERVDLPDAPHLHVFVASGAVEIEGAGALVEGDAARYTAEGGPRLAAPESAEVLVWELP